MPFSIFTTTTTTTTTTTSPLLFLLFLLLLLLISTLARSSPSPRAPPTNLPPPTPAVFTVQSRITINTTVDLAWSALTNLALYPSWNPFIRSATLLSPTNPLAPLPRQYPTEGFHLLLRTQLPPLPLPVDAHTPENPLHTRFSSENVTHVQPELARLAWVIDPPLGLSAHRWQALSDLGHGLVLYETREAFDGPLAGLVRDTTGDALQEAFDAQAKGFKWLLEGEAIGQGWMASRHQHPIPPTT